jgi:hypothetical protein
MSCCVSAILLVTQYTVRTLLDATKSAASSRCVTSSGRHLDDVLVAHLVVGASEHGQTSHDAGRAAFAADSAAEECFMGGRAVQLANQQLQPQIGSR